MAEAPELGRARAVAARLRAPRRRAGPSPRWSPAGRHRHGTAARSAPRRTSCGPPRPPTWPTPSPLALEERWQVRRRRRRWRDPMLGDITILVPARTSLPFLEAALEAARIPFRAESSSLVYASRAVRDLMMVLRAADDPTDHLRIVERAAHPAPRLRRRRPLPPQGARAGAAGAYNGPTAARPRRRAGRRRPGVPALAPRRAALAVPGRAARPHRPWVPGARARLRRGPAS